MFTKTALFKFALVPLAAVTLLAQVVSAGPDVAIQPRAFNEPSGDHFFSPPEYCRMGVDTLPRITAPKKGATWTGTPRIQTVSWGSPKEDPGDGPDGSDSDNQPPEPRCRPGIFLVKDGDKNFRPILLSTGFNLDDTNVEVVVPKVELLSGNYVVVLTLGRLQSFSERFTVRPP